MGKFHPGQKVILKDRGGAVEATIERCGDAASKPENTSSPEGLHSPKSRIEL